MAKWERVETKSLIEMYEHIVLLFDIKKIAIITMEKECGIKYYFY